MDERSNEDRAAQRSQEVDTVQLAVGGQLIEVSWEDLLDPGKWFSTRTAGDER